MCRDWWNQVSLESRSLDGKFSTHHIKPHCLPANELLRKHYVGLCIYISLVAMAMGLWRACFVFLELPDVAFKSTLYSQFTVQALQLLTSTSKLLPAFGQTDRALLNLGNTKPCCQSRLSNHAATANEFYVSLYLSSFKSINCHTDVKVTLFEPKSIFGGAKQAQFSSC